MSVYLSCTTSVHQLLQDNITKIIYNGINADVEPISLPLNISMLILESMNYFDFN